MSTDNPEQHASPRSLAGATILQVVPALREDPVARAAVNVAHALLRAGARAIIAAGEGPLSAELKTAGGESVSLVNETMNPLRIRSNARFIERLIASERIDIVHAHSVGGAWSAQMAAAQIAVWLVTTLPDVPVVSGWRARWASALARGDRVITPSQFAAAPLIAHYGLARDRLTIIPRSIETSTFDPEAVPPDRIEAMRKTWRVQPDERVVLVPGRVAPWNDQLVLPAVVRLLVESGAKGFAFVMAGEHESFRRYARYVAETARAQGVQSLLRFGGHCRDMPAAYAAAHVVMVPAAEPPVLGRAVAEAQALGRPVVTSSVGASPEHVVTPPEMPEDIRTGWVVEPGDAAAFAHALAQAFALDSAAYRAMSARARQFAEYMFSPRSVAVATRAVYTSLLARDHA
ncbi:MAG TPA: glycosyltransferase [Xanthobacteraceae bacterium]